MTVASNDSFDVLYIFQRGRLVQTPITRAHSSSSPSHLSFLRRRDNDAVITLPTESMGSVRQFCMFTSGWVGFMLGSAVLERRIQ